MGEYNIYIEREHYKHLLDSSWRMEGVNLIFLPNLAADMNKCETIPISVGYL